MNNTEIHEINKVDNIYLYLLMGIECVSFLITAWTSYKLNHMSFMVDSMKFCCFECDNLNLVVSDGDIIENAATKSR